MKTVRLNKVKPQVIESYPLDKALQAGKKVKIRKIPEDIKKAKRLFVIGKEYIIQKAPKNYLNTAMAVYLKGRDGKTYLIRFPYFIKLANIL